MTDAVKLAFEIGDEAAKELDCFLVHAEYVKENKESFLRLYIDKEGGAGIDDCEKFSVLFSSRYDRIDPISEPYCLEVSSPGVDRILKTEREFTYFTGREVSVKLYRALDGKKEFDGILKGMDGDRVTVECDGSDISFGLREAVFVRLAFKF